MPVNMIAHVSNENESLKHHPNEWKAKQKKLNRFFRLVLFLFRKHTDNNYDLNFMKKKKTEFIANTLIKG